METSPLPLPDAEKITHEFKEFISIISHDFNAPIRGIIGLSSLLKEDHSDKLDDEGKLYISLINESGEKLQNMINGLLEYSRLTTVVKPHAEINCNHIVRQSIDKMKAHIEAQNGRVEITSLPILSANSEQCIRLFDILLDNAFKFFAADTVPHVKISAEKQQNYWLFSVNDNGIGIEKEFYQQIFLPFKKLHNEHEYSGIGMGLPIARKILEIHGGDIWVDSLYGKGSSFKFTLPCKD